MRSAARHAAIEVSGQQETNQVNIESVGYGGQWGYYTDNETYAVGSSTPHTRLPFTLNGYRYYDPSIGRFLTRDPIGYEGGINLYTFCGNNPVNYADPSGLDALDKLQGLADLLGLIPGANIPAELISGGISLYHGDYIGAGLSVAGLIPVLGDGAVAAKLLRRGEKLVGAAKALRKESKLAVAGEDLFVGTYNQAVRGNLRSGLNLTHSPHHVVQNAISTVSRDKGITMNLSKGLHELTRTYRRPVKDLGSLRSHLAVDIKDLRGILPNAPVCHYIGELIQQNKALGGLSK